MRKEVRVRMTEEQFTALGKLLDQVSHNLNNVAVLNFHDQAKDDFEDDDGISDLLKAARAEFSGDEITIDDDAPLSRNDEGTWVGAWVFVSNEIVKEHSDGKDTQVQEDQVQSDSAQESDCG